MFEPSAPSRTHRALHRLALAMARAMAPAYLRSVTTLGARSRLRGAPLVRNRGRITIGDDFRLDSWPVRSHLVAGRRGFIEIGHRVSIGAGAAISSEAHVRIGDGVRLAPAVMIMDSDYHDRKDRFAAAPGSPIVIDDEACLGRNVTVLKGAYIGRGAWIGPGSVVSGPVPPGACVSGIPARAFSGEAKAPARSHGDADLLERVRQVVGDTFGVTPPGPGDGPATVPGWDSLGALRLLLALEEEFGIVLPDALGEAESVLDLSGLVAARLSRE